MSADNGLILNLKTFKVTYFMGDGEIDSWKCKSLEEAILKCQELGETEYGVVFTGRLNSGKPKIIKDFYKIIERYEKLTKTDIDTALCGEIINWMVKNHIVKVKNEKK